MYESFFQLHERPFLAAPAVERYFAGRAIDEAKQTLARVIERSEGAGMLVGASGTGKTLLCRLLAEQFRDRMEVALLACGRLATRRALLQAILFELGLPFRGRDEGELLLALVEHLGDRSFQHEGLLLIVDEAHTLPMRLLEELRLLTNVLQNGKPRVRLVISGAAILEERFAHPKLESFAQRLSARCYLEPFNRQETQAYVAAQIAAAGGTADHIFDHDAFEAIYRATDGVPRLINQVCDHALVLACAGGHRLLGHSAIEEAWSDLQQLPAPWHEPPAAASGTGEPAANVVEFGMLADDDLDAEPQAEVAETAEVQQASEAEEPAESPTKPTLRMAEVDEPLPSSVEGSLPVYELSSEEDEEEAASQFQPAAFSTTEVELVFHAAHDPFGEKFDEEEVVIDHYAALDADGWRNLPVVTSEESRELARLIEPFAAKAPKPSLSVLKEQGEVEAAEELAAEEPAQPADAAEESAVEPLRAYHEPDEAAAEEECEAAAEPADTVPLAPVAEEEPDEVAEAEPATQSQEDVEEEIAAQADEDLIVVEEDDESSVPAGPHRRAKKLEYRQLFAQLRQGK